MTKFLKTLVFVIFLGTALYLGLWAQVFYGTPISLPAGNPPLFEVPEGADLHDTASLLESQGITPYGRAFMIGSTLYRKNTALKPGEYSLKKGTTLRDLVSILTSGKVYQRRFTIIPGRTVTQVLRKLEDAPAMKGTMTRKPSEGTLLPETYVYIKGQDRQKLLDKIAGDMTQRLMDHWQKRAPNLMLKTPQEALILASIVEKEYGAKDDPAVVASVFHNRLEKKMRLQSDPTVVYGITKGETKLDRRISKEDLATPTPYNTYRMDGLPPTPICNPSERAIKAVLNPAQTDYLYFVADGKGGHRFSATYDDHRDNHAQWRQLRAQGNRNAPTQ